MKYFFLCSLIAFASLVWGAQDWKVVAVSTNNCQEQVQVLAKEGEAFVYVVDGRAKTKIFSDDGSTYSEESGKMITFTNSADKNALPKYTFIQPSMVDPNPAQIQVSTNGVRAKCKMKQK